MAFPGFIAISQQMALLNKMDIVANNIANSDTPGFQAEQPLFAEYLDKASGSGTARAPAYVIDRGVFRDLRPGELTPTGNMLDMAIRGDGYFVVETAGGDTRYTRNGTFQLNASGQLVTSGGDLVLDDSNAPIVFAPDETDILVSRDGSIATENGIIAKIGVVIFANQQAMEKVGNTQLKTDQAPTKAKDFEVVQGVIERSNVRTVLEMTSMIQTMRGYQSAGKLVESENERQKNAIRVLTQDV